MIYRNQPRYQRRHDYWLFKTTTRKASIVDHTNWTWPAIEATSNVAGPADMKCSTIFLLDAPLCCSALGPSSSSRSNS